VSNASQPLIKRQIHDYATKRFFCRYDYNENLVKIFPDPEFMEALTRAQKLSLLNKVSANISKLATNNESLSPIIYRRENDLLAIKVHCDSYQLFLKIGRAVKQAESRYWFIGLLRTLPESLTISNKLLYSFLWLITISGLLLSILLYYNLLPITIKVANFLFYLLLAIYLLIVIITFLSFAQRNLVKKVQSLYLLENVIKMQPVLTLLDYSEIAKAIDTSVGETKKLLKILIKELAITGHFRTDDGLFSSKEYFVYTGPPTDLPEGEILAPEEESEEIRCMRCGAPIPETAEGGCPECGFNLTTCAICNQKLEFDDDISLCPHCNSQFHDIHIKEWLKIKGACPVCRNETRSEELREISIMGILRLLQ